MDTVPTTPRLAGVRDTSMPVNAMVCAAGCPPTSGERRRIGRIVVEMLLSTCYRCDPPLTSMIAPVMNRFVMQLTT